MNRVVDGHRYLLRIFLKYLPFLSLSFQKIISNYRENNDSPQEVWILYHHIYMTLCRILHSKCLVSAYIYRVGTVLLLKTFFISLLK